MKLYVFCHKAQLEPNGGVKVLFEIAQALIDDGFDACILIPGKRLYAGENPAGWTPHWFKTDVPVIDDVDVITSEDVVLIHEESIWAYDELNRNRPRMIMINQGLQSSLCTRNSFDDLLKVYKECLGVITVSRYIADGVNLLFKVPSTKIHRVHNIVDPMFINYNPEFKKNEILVHIKRQNSSNGMLYKILSTRYDWNVRVVENFTLKQMAAAMETAKIFLFLCNENGEGFGMPPVEAALSGCKVIGYSGIGGKEFFDEPLFTEIEYNDINRFVVEVDHWVKELNDTDIFQYAPEACVQRNRLMMKHNKQNFNKNVVTIVRGILNG